MNRLKDLTKTVELADKRIIVTGCGYKPVGHTFYDIVTGESTHDSIYIGDKEMKMNIGAAASGILALSGATVHMVSTSEEKLINLKQEFEKLESGNIEISVADLLNELDVKSFIQKLPSDKQIYWVQSVGLGAGSYKLENDNPYIRLEDIDPDFIEAESRAILRSTHLLMRELLPLFRNQRESKIAIVTSMSAVRGYSLGGSHCASKGALDRYANSAMLALYKDNIFLTTIRPGGVDTGLYDSEAVQKAICQISDEYEGQFREHFTLAPPSSVGQAVKYVFTTPAHIPSLNLVAKGQFPHEGS